MRKRGVSSVIGGILVILIALTAVGAITAYFFWGIHTVNEENQLSNWLTYKDMEQLAVVYNDTSHMLTIKNMWNYPSTITYLIINESGMLKTVPENITLFSDGSTTLPVSGDPVSVLTSYGNEFWANSNTPNPYFSTYSVTIKSGEGGTTNPPPGTYYYPYGSKVAITATPNSGYAFTGWSGTGYGSYSGSSSSATVYIWSNITETANFGVGITFNAVQGDPTQITAPLIEINGILYNTPKTIDVPIGTVLNYQWVSTYQPSNGMRYVFVSVSGLGVSSISGSITATQSGAITATYDLQYYVSTSAPSGVSVSPSSGWYNAGTSLTFSAPSSYSPSSGTRYVFSGWSGTYSSSSTSFTETVNGPISETANFNEQYYLSVSASPPSGGSVGGSGWYNAGATTEAYESPNNGYQFTGWSNGITASTDIITMNGPESLVAYFQPITYSVAFTSSPSGAPVSTNYGSGTTPFTVTVDYGSTLTYTYASTFSGGTGIRYVNPTNPSGSITVTGYQTINSQYTTQYLLTMSANPTSGGSVSPGTTWVNAGSSVSISATPNNGYKFSSWSGSGSGAYSGTSASATITMNNPITETANFVTTTYTVTFTSSPSGAPISTNYGSGTTPYSITVDSGATVSYTYGSSFSGGTGVRYVNPSPSSGSKIITQDTTVNAQYTTQYLLTMSSVGEGAVSPGSAWYNAGTQVTISATPGNGYDFISWSGTGSGSYSGSANPATVTMDSPINEYASFGIASVVYYNSYDYGTGALVGSTVTLTGPATYTISSGGSAYVVPGTYSLSYSTSEYGAGIYSAPSSVSVGSGGSATITATYFTPTVLTASATGTGSSFTVSGQLTGADGRPISGQQISIKWTAPNAIKQSGSGSATTNGNGQYSTLFSIGGVRASGDVQVIATFRESGGYLTSSAETTLYVKPQLSVSISANPTSGYAPLAVSFSSSVSGGSGSYSYSWSFGDGGSSTSANPSHTYSSAGTYTATLTVTDTASGTSATSNSITIDVTQPPPLTASISANPASGQAPITISFTPIVSGGTGGYSYSWYFGIAGASSTQENPSYTYQSAGTYTVYLTVTDSHGDQAFASEEITVTPPPTPTYSVTWSMGSDTFGNTVTVSADGKSTSFGSYGSGTISGLTGTVSWSASPSQITVYNGRTTYVYKLSPSSGTVSSSTSITLQYNLYSVTREVYEPVTTTTWEWVQQPYTVYKQVAKTELVPEQVPEYGWKTETTRVWTIVGYQPVYTYERVPVYHHYYYGGHEYVWVTYVWEWVQTGTTPVYGWKTETTQVWTIVGYRTEWVYKTVYVTEPVTEYRWVYEPVTTTTWEWVSVTTYY